MTNQPTVSVVIPTYNRSWGLRRAVNSVLSQRGSQFEVIIADDSSTDDTEAVARSFHDPRVRYFRQPMNVGVAENWGAGIALARGEFVCLLMDDDFYQPGFILDRLAAFANSAQAIVVFAGYLRADRDGVSHGAYRPAFPTGTTLRGLEFLGAGLSRALFIGASMYRARPLKAMWPSLLSADYVVDFALNLRLALVEGSEAVFLDLADLVVGEHPGQISVARDDEVFALGVGVLENLLAESLPAWARPMILRELFSWHLVGGRRSAARGDRRTALRRLMQSIRLQPLSAAAWKQLTRVVLGV